MSVEINKYHSSKIYKISSSHSDKFYIGSTIQPIKTRLIGHKSAYKIYIEKDMGAYISSFDIVKFEDAKIELIKEIKCENRKELDRIEGDCIKEYHDRILNKLVAGRTHKERYEINKEKINKPIVCECGSKYTSQYTLRHRKTQRHKLFIQTNL
jgi:hypothetical protein